jgi:hypothetical protein
MEILAWYTINKICEEHLVGVIATSNELNIFLEILNILD